MILSNDYTRSQFYTAVKIKDIEYHTRAVRKGAPHSFLLSDLPFMSYCETKQALKKHS